MGLLSGLLGGGKPVVKKKGGHGSHWEVLFPGLGEALMQAVTGSLQHSRRVATVNGDFANLKGAVLSCFEYGESLAFVTILVQRHAGDASEMFTSFPAYFKGAGHAGKVTKVDEWFNGAEAQVEVKLDSGPSLCFFASDYLMNKSKYVVGARVAPKLAGFAYVLGRVTPGEKEIVMKDGRKYSMDEFVGILPSQTVKKVGDVDDYFVWAKVEGESKVTLGGLNAIVFDLTVAKFGAGNNENFTLPVVVSEKTASTGFVKGEKVTGVIWLTGSI